ncbi:hypothetical protein SAMN05443428_10330 [Caloramator quimbayensis]|uniref:Uncharacterized protein n=1 Tax=Caloramator quimbayensis TaxID=1147123 RepID=A0A1T4WPP1_9CLOT|nr:hypothetical protein SAMN05443428_10330 [Caloramator quimbayensis]
MEALIELLDKKLILEKYEIIEDTIYVKYKNSEAVCLP